MKLESIEVMIIKVEEKEYKDMKFLGISLAVMDDGSIFDVTSKDMDLIKLQPFSKHIVNLDLKSSKFGLKLSLIDVD